MEHYKTILALLILVLSVENSDINPIDILRLISELEGSSALMKYMGFNEDREIINTMKKKYYKLYFKLSKDK